MTASGARPRLRRLATAIAAAVFAGTATVTTDAAALTNAAAAGPDGPRGIDVARYQHGGSLSWPAVRRDGVRFAFVKATESDSYVNPYYSSDDTRARRAGIYTGAYHFAQPSVGSAGDQARYFVSQGGSFHQQGDLPPVLDLEQANGLGVRQLRGWVRRWLATVESLTKRKPLIYTSPSFWSVYMGNTAEFTKYRLWVANYNVDQPTVPGAWPRWTFWQWTSTGRVDGISGDVDVNAFQGSRDQLSSLANDGPAPAAPAAQSSSTSLVGSAHAINRGNPLTMSGQLVGNAQALAGLPVTVYRRMDPLGSWEEITTLTTARDGRYRLRLRPARSADYQARYGGVATSVYTASSSAVTTVSVRKPTVTTLAADPSDLPVGGGPVLLSGTVQTRSGDGVVGLPVRVLARPDGAAGWTQVATAITLANGSYEATVTPAQSTEYKSVFPRTNDYSASESDRVRVAVAVPFPLS